MRPVGDRWPDQPARGRSHPSATQRHSRRRRPGTAAALAPSRSAPPALGARCRGGGFDVRRLAQHAVCGSHPEGGGETRSDETDRGLCRSDGLRSTREDSRREDLMARALVSAQGPGDKSTLARRPRIPGAFGRGQSPGAAVGGADSSGPRARAPVSDPRLSRPTWRGLAAIVLNVNECDELKRESPPTRNSCEDRIQ